MKLYINQEIKEYIENWNNAQRIVMIMTNENGDFVDIPNEEPFNEIYDYVVANTSFNIENIKDKASMFLTFRKQDIYTPLPLQSVLLRERFKVYDNEGVEIEYPTIKQIFESIDPDAMTYIKKYQMQDGSIVEFVIVPVTLSSKRQTREVNGEIYRSSEVEELNNLSRMQALYESNGENDDFEFPGSTIMTYDEVLETNWVVE